MTTYQIKPVNDFHLEYTLTSGQVFRWRKFEQTYYGFIGENLLGLRQEDDVIQVEIPQNNPSDRQRLESQIRSYFGLEENLPKILKSLPHDKYLSSLIQRYWGLRVIHQDPWECLASFILSSFNNIKRIQGMIEAICQQFGEERNGSLGSIPTRSVGMRESKMGMGKSTHSHAPRGNVVQYSGDSPLRGQSPSLFYSFPTPARISKASESKLRQQGLGYRAPYLLKTAQMIDSGELDLEALRSLEYGQIRERLLACSGVGEKVVECILLFAYQQWQAFPVDVWIERLFRKYYFPRRKISAIRLKEWAQKYFGPYAGYAQQYFYCSTRI